VNVRLGAIREAYDALLLATGAEAARDLPIPGRELDGIHFAMNFLPQQNRRIAGDAVDPSASITAKGKHAVVIGGGDTGSDCIGTCHRQGALSVTNFELLERPPDARAPHTPWPDWPLVFRTSTSHEEGGTRVFSVLTKRFLGESGRVTALEAVEVRFGPPDATGRRPMEEVPGSAFRIEADLVLLAMGFLGPVQQGLVEELGVKLDARGNVEADRNYMSSEPGVFAAGDARRGQSLVVWAIREGRDAAAGIHRYLQGR
jgi:glutamate synthase (NADPH/NADH) small chain